MSLLDDIRKDRDAGTDGPWALETVKTSCGVCHKVGQFESKGNRGGYSSACIYEDYPWTTPHKMSEPEANARRIARVPQMEDEIIRLREGLEEIDMRGKQYSSEDLADMARALLDGKDHERAFDAA